MDPEFQKDDQNGKERRTQEKEKESPKEINGRKVSQAEKVFFGPSPLPFGGSKVLETYSSTTARSRPRTRGNRSAGSCLCTVLGRALYHYATRSPKSSGKGKSTKEKKGKLNETAEEWDPEESWWWNDNDWWVDGWQDSGVAHVWDDSWLELNTAWSWTQYGKITPNFVWKMHLLETETNRQLEVWFLRQCYMWCQKQTQTIVRHVICAKDVFGNGLFCPTFAGISFEKKKRANMGDP